MIGHEAIYSLVHPTSYDIYVLLQNLNVLNYGVSITPDPTGSDPDYLVFVLDLSLIHI